MENKTNYSSKQEKEEGSGANTVLLIIVIIIIISFGYWWYKQDRQELKQVVPVDNPVVDVDINIPDTNPVINSGSVETP